MKEWVLQITWTSSLGLDLIHMPLEWPVVDLLVDGLQSR